MEECNGQRACLPSHHFDNSNACEVFRVGATGNEDRENTMCARERCNGVSEMVGERTMRLR